jgi:hypothetical protein
MKKRKTPWQIHVEKRARKNVRLIRMASSRLEYRDLPEQPTPKTLGVHLGLITLANCSTKVDDLRGRARWLLHWMLGYLIEQGFTVEEASTENALDAVEALVMAASQAKEQYPGQLKYKNGALLLPDGRPVSAAWCEIYNTAWKFIGGLSNIA